MKETIVTFEGGKYDVTSFDHPGDGIRGIYLQNYNKKDITNQVEQYHMTNYPWELLYKAKAYGEHEGIKYLGPEESSNESHPAPDVGH